MKRTILQAVLTILVAAILPAPGQSAPRTPDNRLLAPLSGQLSGTLTIDQSPYLAMEDLTVPDNATLVIQPGVIIQFSRNARLVVAGRLECFGTMVNTIRFTAMAADTFAGAWGGIYFTTTASAGELRNCVVEYAACGVYVNAAAQVVLNNNIIHSSEHYGVYCIGGAAPVIANNLIKRGAYGIVCYQKSRPQIAGNVLNGMEMAGIYCIEGSSPRIDGNTIAAGNGPAILCLDDSRPVIENNLITNNANGIVCTRSAPLIMYNTIHGNRACGVISYQSTPLVTQNNIFGQSQADLNVVGGDSVLARENWWGPVAAGFDTLGHLVMRPDQGRLRGQVYAATMQVAPCSITAGQPRAITQLEILDPAGTAPCSTAAYGHTVLVRLTGVDGSSVTRDQALVRLSAPHLQGYSLVLLLEETSANAGVYQNVVTINERFLLPAEVTGSSARTTYTLTPVMNAKLKQTLTIVNERPLVRDMAVRQTAPRDRIIVDEPLNFTWVYEDQDRTPQPQTQFELELTDTCGFDPQRLVYRDLGQGTILKYLYRGVRLQEGRRYYARVRARDYANWSDWDTASFVTNTRPVVPRPVFPENNVVLNHNLWPTFLADPITDSDSDQVTYRFEMYRDAAGQQLVEKGRGTTKYIYETWRPTGRLAENQTYWWRVAADDGYETGAWTSLQQFAVNLVEEPIQPFALQYPQQNSILTSGTVKFIWEPTRDPDPNETVTYTLVIATRPDFIDARTISGLTANSYQLDVPSHAGITYYWKVQAVSAKASQWCNTRYNPDQTFTVVQPYIAVTK
jgi:parallel beta-helix repeat protein